MKNIQRLHRQACAQRFFQWWFLCAALLFSAAPVWAQATAFTYQGQLKTSGMPATGAYDFQFRLFDAAAAGNQLGATNAQNNVAVANGVFTVTLDFGAQFTGAARWLDISVRTAGGGAFTVLTPRQPLTAAPYAVRSASAGQADNATNATNATNAANATTAQNALQLGGVVANQYVQTNDARLSDARTPTAGSASYIQNTTSQQLFSNFNISGGGTANNLTAASTLSGGIVNATTQYNLGGTRVLSVAGANNTFAGINAGQANAGGTGNSFFGNSAGQANSGGGGNAFFGYSAGRDNSTANFNAFFGSSAGVFNSTGDSNSFFGFAAGAKNTTGLNNSFFGTEAGNANTTAANNSFFGRSAGKLNTTGASNSFFGYAAGSSNTTGTQNSFFGENTGMSNMTGGGNSIFGYRAGEHNTNSTNSFFGALAGQSNTSGGANSFFGYNAGQANTSGDANSLFGRNAGQANTIGLSNSFFGFEAGKSNIDGNANVFIGTRAGQNLTTGIGNTFIGYQAGQTSTTPTTANMNTLIGYNAKITSSSSQDTITHSTAIGADAVVTNSNEIVLGTASERVFIPGQLTVYGEVVFAGLSVVTLDSGGSTSVCKNQYGYLSYCSSSLRYKTNLAPYLGGFDIIKQLRPITFDWKQGGMHDLGFGAEEVAKVDPLLVTYNKQGQVEGVKYDRISAALVNAVKEQQQQIESLRAALAERLRLVNRPQRRVHTSLPRRARKSTGRN